MLNESSDYYDFGLPRNELEELLSCPNCGKPMKIKWWAVRCFNDNCVHHSEKIELGYYAKWCERFIDDKIVQESGKS